MIYSLYLGRVGYEDALRLQAEMAGLVSSGRLGNVLLLLEHPPVLTLGRNANRANVLATHDLLAARGVTLHQINRGGDVTYHGPGQLVGYPIFDLRTFRNPSGNRMGPVDFVRGMEDTLIGVCAAFGVRAGHVAGLTGVWCGVAESSGQETETDASQAGGERKIGAIGIHVAKGITSHGFAFNVTTDLRDFKLIVPCGIADHGVTSLRQELEQQPGPSPALPSLSEVAGQAARQFGKVFGRQVLAVESLATLRALAAEASAPREFPAQDTPLRIPAEVERLHGDAEHPATA